MQPIKDSTRIYSQVVPYSDIERWFTAFACTAKQVTTLGWSEGEGGAARGWKAADLSPLAEPCRGGALRGQCIAATPAFSVTGDAAGAVRLARGDTIFERPAAHEGPINAIAACGDHFFTGGRNKSVCAWRAGESANLLETLPTDDRVLALAADESKLVAGLSSKSFMVWSRNSPNKTGTHYLGSHDDAITALVLDGHMLYSSSRDRKVGLWDLRTNAGLSTWKNPSPVNALALTASRQVVTGSDDGVVRIWDTEGASSDALPPCTSLSSHREAILDVAVLPEDRGIASLSITELRLTIP